MSAETTATEYHSSPFLDTVWARLIALAIAIGGVLLFIAANEGFLERTLAGRTGGPPTPYQECLDARLKAVASLAEEAGYTTKQKELAEIRAREFCENQVGM